MIRYTYYSPIGNLLIESDGRGITSLILSDEKVSEKDKYIEEAIRWLDMYFNGIIPDFIPHLSLITTEFRKKVYEIMIRIPYGNTMTYKDIAKTISPRMSAQAIGQACKNNPIILIIPCHRVVGMNDIGGFAYGTKIKKILLKHESIINKI